LGIDLNQTPKTMKTLISSIGNDFNRKYTLSVRTDRKIELTYESYAVAADFTKRMIADLKEVHGENSVIVSESYKDWAGEDVVDIVVAAFEWVVVFESDLLARVVDAEKPYRRGRATGDRI
jgi:hypothetical protein